MKKKSTKVLVGWQKKYWRINSQKGLYLTYYEKPNFEGKPSGAFKIEKLVNLEKKPDRILSFEYDGAERVFELRPKTDQEQQNWFDALTFLREVMENHGDFDVVRTASMHSFFSHDEDSKSEGRSSSVESWKFNNFDADTFKGVAKSPTNGYQTSKQRKANEKALETKSISQYIQ